MDFTELEPIQEDKEKYKELRQESKGTTYTYKLYGVPEDYMEVIDTLKKAQTEDTFIIDLFFDGGCVYALFKIKATTVARVQELASVARGTRVGFSVGYDCPYM